MNKQIVAAFDFDGTITTSDTLVPFLIHLKGWTATTRHLLKTVTSFIRFLKGSLSRQATKEKVMALIAGTSKKELDEKGRSFALGPVRKLIRPEALKRLQWHREQGHRCVLISANIDPFLVPWGEEHHFDDLICSILQYDAQNKATGKLVGLNCWGPEKARRLLELLGPREGFELYAYGDSRGDKEMLEMADHPFYRSMS